MPDQSWYPLFASIGMFIGGCGMIFKARLVEAGMENWYFVPLTGAAILFVSAYLWALEGPGGYHLHPGEDDDGSYKSH
jgi:cytochrome c oxidase subunit 1